MLLRFQEGINLDCKVVGDCKPLPSVDDTVMIDRVLECAAPATGYGMINATTFLNHVVDTKLMDEASVRDHSGAPTKIPPPKKFYLIANL